MAIDEHLCENVRVALASARVATHGEVKMFGGVGFMLDGNFVAGASARGLLVRVGKDRQSQALARTGARPMIMRGRIMEGYVHVDPDALDTRSVKSWLRLAVAYVRTLPAKASKSTLPAARRQTRRKGQ